MTTARISRRMDYEKLDAFRARMRAAEERQRAHPSKLELALSVGFFIAVVILLTLS